MEEANSSIQVSWNLSASIIQEIAECLQQATKYFSAGHCALSYKHLNAIEMRISCYFTTEEKAALKVISKKLEKPREIATWKHGDREVYENAYLEAYREYNDAIMDALKKYGFLIKQAEDSKRMF